MVSIHHSCALTDWYIVFTEINKYTAIHSIITHSIIRSDTGGKADEKAVFFLFFLFGCRNFVTC